MDKESVQTAVKLLGEWVEENCDNETGDQQLFKANHELGKACKEGDPEVIAGKLEAFVSRAKALNADELPEDLSSLVERLNMALAAPQRLPKSALARSRPESGMPFTKKGKPPGSLGN